MAIMRLVWILLLLLACGWPATDKFQYVPLKKNKTYPLTLTPVSASATNILVDLPEQNELKELGEHEDVYLDHPHPAEYHNGTLYLVRKKQTFNGVLTELWQHRGGKSTLVYAAYDYLTFRVSPDDKYLAIFADRKLLLMTTAGEKKRVLDWQDFYPRNTPPKAEYFLTPADWNDKSTEFWFVLKDTGNRVARVFYLSSQNWKYVAYDDLPQKPIEYAVSPLGRIAYSDRGLNARQNIFTLHTYNLRTKRTEVVATSNYAYEPEWRGNSLDFNSPTNGKTRLTRGE